MTIIICTLSDDAATIASDSHQVAPDGTISDCGKVIAVPNARLIAAASGLGYFCTQALWHLFARNRGIDDVALRLPEILTDTIEAQDMIVWDNPPLPCNHYLFACGWSDKLDRMAGYVYSQLDGFRAQEIKPGVGHAILPCDDDGGLPFPYSPDSMLEYAQAQAARCTGNQHAGGELICAQLMREGICIESLGRLLD